MPSPWITPRLPASLAWTLPLLIMASGLVARPGLAREERFRAIDGGLTIAAAPGWRALQRPHAVLALVGPRAAADRPAPALTVTYEPVPRGGSPRSLLAVGLSQVETVAAAFEKVKENRTGVADLPAWRAEYRGRIGGVTVHDILYVVIHEDRAYFITATLPAAMPEGERSRLGEAMDRWIATIEFHEPRAPRPAPDRDPRGSRDVRERPDADDEGTAWVDDGAPVRSDLGEKAAGEAAVNQALDTILADLAKARAMNPGTARRSALEHVIQACEALLANPLSPGATWEARRHLREARRLRGSDAGMDGAASPGAMAETNAETDAAPRDPRGPGSVDPDAPNSAPRDPRE